jgi:nucleoside-diphosphate-sugar epimerase
MQILITGGTGFIGSRLALKLLRDGHQVRVTGLTNTPAEDENRASLERHGAEVMLGPTTDAGLATAATRGVEVVFHLAAAQHELGVPDSHFWNVNVEGTRQLLEAATNAGVTRFVHGSTIGVYGSPAGAEIDGSTPAAPDNVYGATKYEGEKLVLSRAAKLPVTVIRISETYGPADRRLLKLFKAVQKRMFVMIGQGGNYHQPIYVDDLAEGLWQAGRAEQARGRVLILAGKEALTTKQIVVAIGKAVGARDKVLRAPMWPFWAAAVICETTLRPLGIQPPLHRRRMDFFRKSFRLSIRNAENAFGFDPQTSFQQGAAQTVEWYRAHGDLS